MSETTNKIQRAAQAQAQAPAKSAQSNMKAYLAKMEGEIAKALPSVITPERFTRIVMTALSTTPQLAECTPASFMGAMMTAAQLGLEPNTPLGQAYLIPYRNHGKLEAQFQCGYKGLIDLAYRSDEVATIQAHEVHENDVFEYELGLNPTLRHIPALTNRGKVILYYAMFKLVNGGFAFEVMSREDIEAHARKYSKSYGSGYSSPWATNFDEMAKKTVLKKALKYAPLKSDFARGIAADGSIKAGLAEDMSLVPNEEMEVLYEVEAEEAATGDGSNPNS